MKRVNKPMKLKTSRKDGARGSKAKRLIQKIVRRVLDKPSSEVQTSIFDKDKEEKRKENKKEEKESSEHGSIILNITKKKLEDRQSKKSKREGTDKKT